MVGFFVSFLSFLVREDRYGLEAFAGQPTCVLSQQVYYSSSVGSPQQSRKEFPEPECMARPWSVEFFRLSTCCFFHDSFRLPRDYVVSKDVPARL